MDQAWLIAEFLQEIADNDGKHVVPEKAWD